jgi:GrpB-like predicted nucleotidyltransferase (UPF0157 family)
VIQILPYNPNWPISFQSIAADLRRALGDRALRIDHIGSTSVPGLAAKDRIDIQVTVHKLSEDIRSSLIELGFNQWRNLIHDHIPPGVIFAEEEWEKWLFTNREDNPSANIHIRINGRINQRYPLLFRDYLRTHPATAQAYAELKQRLASNLADPKSYPDVKDPAVDLIYLAAVDWAAIIGWQPDPSDA